jgi:hypothetical protein
MHVQHTTPEATVGALNESVLHWPPGLDEVHYDVFAFCPFSQGQCDELQPIVQAQLGGITAIGLPR